MFHLSLVAHGVAPEKVTVDEVPNDRNHGSGP